MKELYEATWDTISLGLKCYEGCVSCKNSVKPVLDEIIELDKQISPYLCTIKVAVPALDIVPHIEREGYSFAETLIGFESTRNRFNYFHKRMPFYDKSINSVLLTHDYRKEALVSEIQNELFATDRISLSSDFGKTHAAVRYSNWVMNCLQDGTAKVWEFQYNDAYIGFMMVSFTQDKLSLLLGGLYQGFRNKGLFTSCIISLLKEILKGKNSTVSTNVSSNNIDIINLYPSVGFMVSDIQYVFVKRRG